MEKNGKARGDVPVASRAFCRKTGGDTIDSKKEVTSRKRKHMQNLMNRVTGMLSSALLQRDKTSDMDAPFLSLLSPDAINDIRCVSLWYSKL
jgi:hypothetical protein